MTLTELQVFLCLRDRVHLYRMEAGTVPIPGPVWVALRDRLRDAGLDYLCSHVEAVLHQMREKVEERNLTMRQQQGQRRREKPGMNGIRGEEG